MHHAEHAGGEGVVARHRARQSARACPGGGQHGCGVGVARESDDDLLYEAKTHRGEGVTGRGKGETSSEPRGVGDLVSLSLFLLLARLWLAEDGRDWEYERMRALLLGLATIKEKAASSNNLASLETGVAAAPPRQKRKQNNLIVLLRLARRPPA